MAMKYCEQHGIWYDYKEGCPECGKFGRVAGSIIGNVIGGGIWATVTAARKIKEYNKKQKEIEATRISATIHKVWQEHNVVVKGNSGMNIHVHFDVNNMLNLSGSCNAYFYDRKKNPLKDINQSYCSVNGQVSVWNTYTPPYQSCTYNDFILFIPYSELHLPVGEHRLKFHVEIFDCNSSSLTLSDSYEFNVNWQGEQRAEISSRKIDNKTNRYSDIISIIQKVIDYAPSGSAVILINDLYVQFCANNKNYLIVEAVSQHNIQRIGNKDNEFMKMGYTLDVSGWNNYKKIYSTSDLMLIVREIVQIFENIYKVSFIDYKIDDNC